MKTGRNICLLFFSYFKYGIICSGHSSPPHLKLYFEWNVSQSASPVKMGSKEGALGDYRRALYLSLLNPHNSPGGAPPHSERLKVSIKAGVPFLGLQSQEVVELEFQSDSRCPKWYHCYYCHRPRNSPRQRKVMSHSHRGLC